jgi:hypothetical protein
MSGSCCSKPIGEVVLWTGQNCKQNTLRKGDLIMQHCNKGANKGKTEEGKATEEDTMTGENDDSLEEKEPRSAGPENGHNVRAVYSCGKIFSTPSRCESEVLLMNRPFMGCSSITMASFTADQH